MLRIPPQCAADSGKLSLPVARPRYESCVYDTPYSRLMRMIGRCASVLCAMGGGVNFEKCGVGRGGRFKIIDGKKYYVVSVELRVLT